MPEQVQPNKPLAGTELNKIIVKDLSNMLDQDGMLAAHIAYNRVAYSITVKIMTGNPIIPNWNNKAKSKKATLQQIEKDETRAAIEAFPLTPIEGEEVSHIGIERTRTIVSANHSRIENELPVPVSMRTSDGDVKEEKIKYDISMLPDDDPYADVVVQRELREEEIKVDD